MDRSRRLSNVLFTFLGAAAVGLIIAILSLHGALDDLAGNTSQPAALAPPRPSTIDAAPAPAGNGSAPTDVSDIYARVAPGVAFIAASGAPATTPFGAPQQSSASGSGFLIDAKGHVVTNDHVVEGADRFRVRFGEDGRALD